MITLRTKVPGRVVHKRVKKHGGRKKIVPLFRFDENGLATIDDSKLTETDVNRLKAMFEVVEDSNVIDEPIDSEYEQYIRDLCEMYCIEGHDTKEVSELETLLAELEGIIVEKKNDLNDKSNETVINNNKYEDLDKDQLRQIAKDKGISSWHLKSIANIIDELNEMEG